VVAMPVLPLRPYMAPRQHPQHGSQSTNHNESSEAHASIAV
jgi:hypothetical protein